MQLEIRATDTGAGVQEVAAILDAPGMVTAVWRFRMVTVIDALQNRRTLDAADLEAAGWPATVRVSN